ncbi:Apolipoprotein n-acyltransferase [Mycena chlorophos]|uniref:Apolipoprotein n-acyltransferase n=1 Tax=Mycena chlorophos TaxID=658473 RepID=A0A8H6T6F3_MYCCL|nr:Apolipoprotein n-acyltransferase [Mycena chlorophos]
MFGNEPFEESQGRRANTVPERELAQFYEDARRGDLERKLSKRKSNSGGSLWSRKSTKRNSTQPPAPPVPGPSRRTTAPPLTSPSASSLAHPPPSISEHGSEWADSVVSLPLSRSIIPEPLRELPAWYDSAHFNTRYAMHNPVGPKWYKNHHLMPPAGSRPAGRPPSVFSPSFPPMSSGDRGEDARMPIMSRSSSKSPLPTPNSSQTRMEDVSNMPRSRKTSQTAHDNVDLMDGSDPWGTAWHHESPYDVGKSNSPVSVDENAQATRSRASSVTAPQNRRKTVTPSPLSQSTSAVHLQVPEPARAPTRKLSKRRTVGIFGRHTASPTEGLDSRVASPVATGPPSSFSPIETTKKERRGSVLGKIAKRFSLMRKPTAAAAPMMEVVRQAPLNQRQPSPEKTFAPEPTNYAPAPAPAAPQELAVAVVPVEPEPATPVEDDAHSTISLDATYRMGRLMVANPDPGSPDSTPVPAEMRLPSDDRTVMDHHSRDGTNETMTPVKELDIPRTQSPESIVQSLPVVQTPQAPPAPQTPPLVPPPPPPASSPSLSSLGMPLSSPQFSTLDQSFFASRPDSMSPPAPLPKSPLATTASLDQHLFAVRSESPPPPTPLPKSPLPTPPIEIPAHRTPSPTKVSPTKRASPTKPSVVTSPSPQKNSPSFANDHRFERPLSAVRPAVESPPLNGAGSSRRVPVPKMETLVEKTPPVLPPSPKLPAVPFPANYGPPEAALRPQSQMTPADMSPLSAVSVLVNPPTPYNADLQTLDETESIPPPVPSKRMARDPSPSQVAVTGRETETFRLVRSASGTVYASTETIHAAGEQWEVMESSRSKSKRRKEEPERNGRSERKRQSADVDLAGGGPNSQTFPRTASEPQRPPIPEKLVQREESPRKRESQQSQREESPRKRDTSREESPRKRDAERKTDRKIRLDKPQPTPPSLAPSSSRKLERNPSNSRPISEVPPVADMTQMRAREAWDMDRLWKARSLYSAEPNGIMTPPPPVPSKDAVGVQQLGVHGSSHTAFMMSAPFQQQQQPPPLYHSMPPPPAPMVYTNGASSSLPPLSNPLPEPPRESPYQPDPLTLGEYWSKHANATTAH